MHKTLTYAKGMGSEAKSFDIQWVYDGGELGSTGRVETMEMSRASWVNARKNIAANDNAPIEAMALAA